MTFCKTQLALAAGVATIAVGVTWYLNPAVRRWRRLRKHARRALPPPRCAVVAAVVDAASVESAASVENMAGPEQQQQQREMCREAAEKRRNAYELDICRKTSSWCMHLLELPDDLLVLILTSLPAAQWHAIRTSTPSGNCYCCTCRALAEWGTTPVPCCTARQGTVGKALASAGACCKTFANGVTEAATVVAGHHGWRLPLAGCAPVRHLSKLEQDTMRVRVCLRANSWLSKPPYYYIEYVIDFWTAELSLALSAPSLYIDAQVRRQHTLELGALLFRAAMDVWRRNGKTSRCCTQLLTMMAHPGTPLDASWLAAGVTPYMEKYILDIVICDRLKNSRRIGMVELLSHLEPHVLRDYPEILKWLQMSSVAL